MNILFISMFDISPQKGGTERITSTLAESFAGKYGHKCYLGYYIEIDPVYNKTFFEAKIHLVREKERKQLKQFISHYQINVILIQGLFGKVKLIRNLIQNKYACKIIFAHHLFPGVEKDFLHFRDVWPKSFRLKEILKGGIKTVLYPVLKFWKVRYLPVRYREAYQFADKTVLLSSRLVPVFMKCGNIHDSGKFVTIPNTLSYDQFITEKEIGDKLKEVLIVSRLEENPKRISLAIKIWQEIEKQNDLQDWKLIIIGQGSSEGLYKQLVAELGLKNVIFKGVKEPLVYYKRASVFMMTSALESWGLTLTEAQQMGVVPIAFDSYPCLRDIIIPNENGIIVPEADMMEYTDQLTFLMKNTLERRRLALNAMKYSRKFSMQIIEIWMNLLIEQI